MNNTVRIIGIAIGAGIIAFAVFQIGLYVWVDNIFHRMFGGHLYTDYDNKVEEIREIQQRHEARMLEQGMSIS